MPKILVLDDQELILRTAARVFRMNGFEAVTTTEPSDFERLLQVEKPGLALVDIKLGDGVRGDHLVRAVLQKQDGHRCPLILWSSLPAEEVAELAKACGAAGYIHKSAGPAEFVEKVREFLR